MAGRRQFAISAGTLAILCALLTGCQSVQLPAIDPTGQRVFLPRPAYTTLNAPWSGASATSLPQPAFTQPPPIPNCPELPAAAGLPAVVPLQPVMSAVPATVAPVVGSGIVTDRLIVTPARMVAPVNTEVILLGGICGADGYYVMQQPVEWMLSPDSVGTFVDVGDAVVAGGGHHLHRSVAVMPQKLAGDFAVSRTSTVAHLITRGTPSPTDDVWLQRGQAWVSLSSPTEGVSYITAVARASENWEQRRQVAKIHWVDAQWVLPSPSVVRAGQSQTLTTVVSRSSSSQPVAGWLVRYEIADGQPAALSQDGAQVVEQPTDAAGRATVQVFPMAAQAGSTRLRITILSPTAGEYDAPIAVGEGWTTVSWSAPGLSVQATGPHTAALDATATYQIHVSNSGDLPANNVQVTAFVPPSLVFLNSQPPAERFGERVQWQLGQLQPGASQTLVLNCRVGREGDIRLRVEATADGLAHEASVATRVVAPALEVRVVDGPTTAAVGDRVHFNVEVANIGSARLSSVVVRDTFDAGLEHTYGQSSPIERSVGDLEPGQVSQFGVSFIVRREGQLCHTLQATAAGGHTASVRACVEVAARRLGLRVRVTGPGEARVGGTAEYLIEVTNTGDGPLTDVEILDLPSQSLSPARVSPGYTSTPAGLRWMVSELPAGQTETRRVVCNCIAPDPRAENRATVTTAEGVRETDVALTVIRAASTPPAGGAPAPAGPAGPPAGSGIVPSPLGPVTGRLQMALSTAASTIRVGQSTTILAELVNDRSEPDREVVLTFKLPAGLELERFVSVSSELRLTQRSDGTYEVETIREMRPSDRRTFRIEVVARQAGDQTFRAAATSLRSESPVEAFQVIRVQP